MERPEYDTWFRVELFERGRWVPAPSMIAPDRSADFDTEEGAHAWGHAMYPRQEWSQYRHPVRGQWRVHRVRGQR